MKYFKDGKPNPEFLKKLEAGREFLTSSGYNLPQGALAWLRARNEQTIFGFRAVEQAEETCRALKFGPLNNDYDEGNRSASGKKITPLARN